MPSTAAIQRRLEGRKAFKSPQGRKLYDLYIDLLNFRDDQDYDAADTVDTLKKNAILSAASLVHDKALEVEFH